MGASYISTAVFLFVLGLFGAAVLSNPGLGGLQTATVETEPSEINYTDSHVHVSNGLIKSYRCLCLGMAIPELCVTHTHIHTHTHTHTRVRKNTEMGKTE